MFRIHNYLLKTTATLFVLSFGGYTFSFAHAYQTDKSTQCVYTTQLAPTEQTSHTAQPEQTTLTAEILSLFTAKIKSYAAFEMKFSMAVEGSDFEAVVQSQGESFRFSNPQLELYCNGTSKWLYNIDNKELTIMANDPSQTDITENPLAFLTSLEKGYTYNKNSKSASLSSMPVWKIELRPINKKVAYASITLVIEKNSLLPVSVEYLAKNGVRHVAKISSFLEKPLWPASYFTFPSVKMAGLTVTDLR